MASSGYRPEPEGVYDINVTPLVDVVLVLLVIFMVTAPAIAKRGIAFREPQTISGSAIASPLEITIADDREVFIDGEPVTDLESARVKLAAIRRDQPDIKALITADIRVPHGDVMALLDTIKLAGIKKFAFASQRKRPE